MSTPHARFRRSSFGLLLVVLACIIHASPSSGQYMYLDTNGDGIHTAADQVHPAGVTVADIWIDTDSNRDGSAVVCSTDPSRPMTINSYVFALMASNGTIDWLNFTNQLAGATILFSQGSSATEYWIGFGGPVINPPGTYRLGTLNFSAASGTPSIQFIPRATGSVDYTSFGSNCDGIDFDNTLKLGTDWNDADGLPFGSGGGQGPLLAPVQDMNVPAGESASQALSATDADGQPLSFTKASGPNYANVVTVTPGSGTASGAIYLAPFVADIGSAEIVVSVSDGAGSDQGTLTATVVSSPNHAPRADLPTSVAVAAGAVRRIGLNGSDSDGQLLHWSLVSGPAFARVLDLETRPGGAAGILELTPGLSDVGSVPVTVGITDGATATHYAIGVQVLPEPALPPDPVHTAMNPHGPVAIATGDFNHDGLADMATANGAANSVTIYQTQASGALTTIGEIPTGDLTWAIVAGDVNEDGTLDLVALNRAAGSIRVLIGTGNGTFTPLPPQAAGNIPSVLRSADLNADGFLDLALGNQGSDDISVLLGIGDGTFVEGPRVPVVGEAGRFAIGDLDIDGRLDLVVPVRSAGEIRILEGFGNGTFAFSEAIPVGGLPEEVVLSDWNADGLLDFAVPDFSTNIVRIVLGQPDGTFEAVGSLSGSSNAVSSGDVDSDGNDDIVLTTSTVGAELQIFYGAGNGTFPALHSIASPGVEALSLADANGDGFLDVFLSNVGYGEMVVRLIRYECVGSAQARVFVKNNRPISLTGGSGSGCFLLEPVGGSYQNTDLVISSLRLRSTGTGSISEISPIRNKSLVESDADRNGTPEISVCFARQDLARLYDQIQGRQLVTADLVGELRDGRNFCSSVLFEITGGGGSSLAATVSPNPLNPRATLRFSTSRDGAVKIRMYDLHGRLVRTLFERPTLPAGSHEVEIDGRAESGQTLASGIYFYKVETAEGTVHGRMTILK